MPTIPILLPYNYKYCDLIGHSEARGCGKRSEIVDLQLTNQISGLLYPTIPYNTLQVCLMSQSWDNDLVVRSVHDQYMLTKHRDIVHVCWGARDEAFSICSSSSLWTCFSRSFFVVIIFVYRLSVVAKLMHQYN